MFEDFLTLEFVLSFPGMISVSWLVVQLIKNLMDHLFGDLKTKWVVFVTALVLVGFKTLFETTENETFTFLSVLMLILMWLINSVVVWFATMKAHEMLYEGGK